MAGLSFLKIPDKNWEPASTGTKVLRTTVVINGVHFHFMAIAVAMENDTQVGVDQETQDYLDDVSSTFDPDGPFETIKINGADYVVVAAPFC